jgi:hypothetical protein
MSQSNYSARSSRYKFTLQHETKEKTVEKQIVEISAKLDKAKMIKSSKQSSLQSRIHKHNTEDVREHQIRSNQMLSAQIRSFSRKIA